MIGISANVAAREVGQLPVSIATAVALETLLLSDNRNEWPDELWINIRTLFRNLMGAIDSDLKKRVLADHLVPTLVTEMQFIAEQIPASTEGKTKVVYYHCSYKDLTLKLPNALLRNANTDLQRQYLALENSTMDLLFKKSKTGEITFKEFKTDIDGKDAKAIIITHSPCDLLSAKTFSRLKLLESHTGAIKGKSEWNTKLTNGKELTRIPFNKFTLQVFGDNNTYLSAMPIKIRNAVLEIAEEYKWTPVTTMDKIKYGIDGMRDHFGREYLRKIARS